MPCRPFDCRLNLILCFHFTSLSFSSQETLLNHTFQCIKSIYIRHSKFNQTSNWRTTAAPCNCIFREVSDVWIVLLIRGDITRETYCPFYCDVFVLWSNRLHRKNEVESHSRNRHYGVPCYGCTLLQNDFLVTTLWRRVADSCFLRTPPPQLHASFTHLLLGRLWVNL